MKVNICKDHLTDITGFNIISVSDFTAVHQCKMCIDRPKGNAFKPCHIVELEMPKPKNRFDLIRDLPLSIPKARFSFTEHGTFKNPIRKEE